tara:strand:- start:99 stop:710 length:612 start_codon:yes stop_codon:yes gene_type:complete
MIHTSQDGKFSIGFNAKCGCTFIGKWIMSQHKGSLVLNENEVYGRTNAVSGKPSDNAYKVGVFRNPTDRIVSAYYGKKADPRNPFYEEGLTFSSFVDRETRRVMSGERIDHHWSPQHTQLLNCNVIFCLNEVEEAMKHLEQKFNLTQFSNQITDMAIKDHKIREKSGLVWPKVTEEDNEKIREAYRQDFILSKYVSQKNNKHF